MTSLTDVYEGRMGTVASQRQLYLGAGLFVLGAGLVVVGIVVATTDLAARADLGTYQARELAGLLAGLGLPAVMAGAFTVLPAGRRTSAGAAVGTGITLFGVALFWYTYPTNWIGGPEPSAALTLATTIVYFAGAATTGWCLFLAVATFKTRRDPGGTARMRLTEEGRIRLIEEADTSTNVGGVGLFGTGPDGEVPTQTGPSGQPASDGGATVQGGDDATLDATTERGQPDKYCGNCEHFSYVRTDDGIVPHCGLHEEYMDDIDACEEWTPNYEATSGPGGRKPGS